MRSGRLDMLRGQFDLTWSLADHHLSRLTTEALLWEPAPRCWTVRRHPDGSWRPDWQIPEPDPIPPPTGAWVSWHLGWWWTTALDHLNGRPVRAREDVSWPGSAEATVAWLHRLRDAWTDLLDHLDDTALDADAPFPWPPGSGRTVADTLAWANAELMKNVAEIGQLALLYSATHPRFT